MPVAIELTETERFHADKPWMAELLALSLDSDTLREYMRKLIATSVSERRADELLHDSFIRLYVSFSIDEAIDFNPSDDLLFRLKWLDNVSGTQFSKTLYSEIQHYRVIKVLQQLPAYKDLLITRRFLHENDSLYASYRDHSFWLDDELLIMVLAHKNDCFYRCDVSSRLEALFRDFHHHQTTLQSLFIFMKLGELVRAEFPGATLDDLEKRLLPFLTGVKRTAIKEFYPFHLIQQVSEQMIPQVDANDQFYSLSIGRKVLLHFCKDSYRTPEVKPQRRMQILHEQASIYIRDELIAHTMMRHRLDHAIHEITLYGRQKALSEATGDKSRVALQLAHTLQTLSDNYFSEPRKTADLCWKFRADCRVAVLAADAIIGVHQTPRWQRLMANVLLVVSAVLTLGFSLLAKRYYSQVTTGSATFFNDRTRGVGKMSVVLDLMTADEAPEAALMDAPGDLSMTLVSRSHSM